MITYTNKCTIMNECCMRRPNCALNQHIPSHTLLVIFTILTFILCLASTSSIASSEGHVHTCIDNNACTFDWYDTIAHECKHQTIPPACQPLLMHSNPGGYHKKSSINAHADIFRRNINLASQTTPSPSVDDLGTSDSLHPLTPSDLTSSHVDLIFLISITPISDAQLIASRFITFVTRVLEENFLPSAAAPFGLAKPFMTIGLYNSTHTNYVQTLTDTTDVGVIRAKLNDNLIEAIRSMQPLEEESHIVPSDDVTSSVPSPSSSTIDSSIYSPIRLYSSLDRYISEAESDSRSTSASQRLIRPYAHQHIVVLESLGHNSTGEYYDADESRRASDESLLAATNLALAKLLTRLASTHLALSFALFVAHHPNRPLFEASVGSAQYMVSYPFGGNHYNRGETLNRLLTNPDPFERYQQQQQPRSSLPSSIRLPSQDRSFVAQLLARSYTARVYEIDDIDRMTSSQYGHLFEAHYIHPRHVRPWCSACQRMECRTESGWMESSATISCASPSEVCSILHGCHTPLPIGALRQSRVDANLTIESIGGVTSIRNGEVIQQQLEKDERQLILDEEQKKAASALAGDEVAGDGKRMDTVTDTEIEVEVALEARDGIADVMDASSFATDINSTKEALVSNASANASSDASSPFPLFHTRPYPADPRGYTHHMRVVGSIPTLDWQPDRDFAATLIAGGRPVILKNSVVTHWSAMKKWSGQYLRRAFEDMNATMSRTKISRTRKFFDPDLRTPLSIPLLLNLSMTYRECDLTPEQLFQHLTKNGTQAMGAGEENDTKSSPSPIDADHRDDGNDDELNYYFGAFPPSLLPDIYPHSQLFDTDLDLSKAKMFLWLSSGGVKMHTHFDQDHNFFVQIIGHKRFTLVMPEDWEEMHRFPRIHPLWHKSQVDLHQPDLELFPNYKRVKTYIAEVGPGDVLYLPPYTWHHVESVTPSVSMSIWSHDVKTLQLMEHIYLFDHKIDLLADSRGRRFALRLYIDLLIQKIFGQNETTKYIQTLVRNNYRSLVDLFREEEEDEEDRLDLSTSTSATTSNHRPTIQTPLCPTDRIPTAQHVLGDVLLDVDIITGRFLALQPASRRDLLLGEYLEELVAAVVGPTRAMRFLIQCFKGQTYRVTNIATKEHDILWKHV